MNGRFLKSGRVAVLAAALTIPAGTSAHAADPTLCRSWLRTTLARVEKRPEVSWRTAILNAFGEQRCVALPAPLLRELRALRPGRETAASERKLADAAAAVLGPQCAVADPRLAAETLLPACSLPTRPEFELQGQILSDLRASDYVLIGALATILISSNAYDGDGRRLMTDLLLSAALRGASRGERRRR